MIVKNWRKDKVSLMNVTSLQSMFSWNNNIFAWLKPNLLRDEHKQMTATVCDVVSLRLYRCGIVCCHSLSAVCITFVACVQNWSSPG